MTDVELLAALDAMAVQVDDARWGPRIVEARRAFALGDPITAADFFLEVVWAAYMGRGPLYSELRELAVEMARRLPTPPPPNFAPPNRYGSLRG